MQDAQRAGQIAGDEKIEDAVAVDVLGLKAIERGYRVLFATAAGLIAALTKAAAEGRFDERLAAP